MFLLLILVSYWPHTHLLSYSFASKMKWRAEGAVLEGQFVIMDGFVFLVQRILKECPFYLSTFMIIKVGNEAKHEISLKPISHFCRKWPGLCLSLCLCLCLRICLSFRFGLCLRLHLCPRLRLCPRLASLPTPSLDLLFSSGVCVAGSSRLRPRLKSAFTHLTKETDRYIRGTRRTIL